MKKTVFANPPFCVEFETPSQDEDGFTKMTLWSPHVRNWGSYWYWGSPSEFGKLPRMNEIYSFLSAQVNSYWRSPKIRDAKEIAGQRSWPQIQTRRCKRGDYRTAEKKSPKTPLAKGGSHCPGIRLDYRRRDSGQLQQVSALTHLHTPVSGEDDSC